MASTPSSNRFERHAAAIVFGVVVIVAVLLLGGAEVLLSALAPTAIRVSGFLGADKARAYGWAYDPGELIRIVDPDSGAVAIERMNRHGWRDRERGLDKPPGVYRVLVVGDSNVFGLIAPGPAVFTRVLEDRFRAEGKAVEVLNMGISNWGTDQELEALRREGLAYRPDLVIFHFSTNDLDDNLRQARGFKHGRRIPFYMELAGDDAVRHDNPRYRLSLGVRIKEWFLRHSEVAKRVYLAWRNLGEALKGREVQIHGGQLAVMKLILGDRPEAKGFLDELAARHKKIRTRAALRELLTRHGLGDAAEPIERIAGLYAHNSHAGEGLYRGAPPPVEDSPAWKLYAAITAQAAKLAREAGAGFALSTDAEIGLYRHYRHWHMIGPDDAAREAFLSFTDRLRQLAERLGVGFIEPTEPVERARNDNHPNAAGNRAMAENFYRFIAPRLPPPPGPADRQSGD